jgi:hypothetical protein
VLSNVMLSRAAHCSAELCYFEQCFSAPLSSVLNYSAVICGALFC